MTSQALSDKMETIEKLLCVEGSQDLTRQTRSTLRASPPSAVHEDTNEVSFRISSQPSATLYTDTTMTGTDSSYIDYARS